MPEIGVSVVMIKDSVMDQLTAIKKDLKQRITCGLSVVGHDYWVVLEYGSAPAEEGTRQEVRNDQAVITIPSYIPGPSTEDHTHEVMVGGTSIQSKWYPITARLKKSLYFIDRNGNERMQKMVYHPGIKARGFLRRCIRAWKQRMIADLEQWTISSKQGGGIIPTRRDLVSLLNFNLRILLAEVKEATPVGIKPSVDGSHLRDAWFIIEAT